MITKEEMRELLEEYIFGEENVPLWNRLLMLTFKGFCLVFTSSLLVIALIGIFTYLGHEVNPDDYDWFLLTAVLIRASFL